MRIAYAACSCQEAIVKQLAQQGPAKAAGHQLASLVVAGQAKLGQAANQQGPAPMSSKPSQWQAAEYGVLARSSLIYVPIILYGFWR